MSYRAYLLVVDVCSPFLLDVYIAIILICKIALCFSLFSFVSNYYQSLPVTTSAERTILFPMDKVHPAGEEVPLPWITQRSHSFTTISSGCLSATLRTAAQLAFKNSAW